MNQLPSSCYCRVVKLGGSLLDLSDLADRLRRWIRRQPPALNIILVGGGRLADAIRSADRLHSLGEDPAHWLCIRAMSLTAEMIAGLFDEIDLIREYDILRSLVKQRGQAPRICSEPVPFVSPRSVIFDPEPFLRHDEPACPGSPLPHGWHITSDSIAARLAVVLDADELVLLKSASPPAENFEQAARGGYVDEGFPSACLDVRAVRSVDFRG